MVPTNFKTMTVLLISFNLYDFIMGAPMMQSSSNKSEDKLDFEIMSKITFRDETDSQVADNNPKPNVQSRLNEYISKFDENIIHNDEQYFDYNVLNSNNVYGTTDNYGLITPEDDLSDRLGVPAALAASMLG